MTALYASRGANVAVISKLYPTRSHTGTAPGGIGAAFTFAATVVSVPLLLDRRIDLGSALITSVRAVGANPLPMALWAAIIMVFTALSMATAMIGFAFAIPVIGHASWHAYRATVDASGVPPRIE